MTDSVRLTIPRARPYYAVARLVVGGLAARLDLSYDYLEDMQVALESLDAYVAGREMTVELVVEPEGVDMLVGPLERARLRPELEREDAPEREGVGEGVTLRRLLAAVVETVEIEERVGGEWLRLRKRARGGAPA
ncbi:MAG: hypothetical protein M3312_08570 [Actinomycetota bacterium]|nr:hypothetical protein [Actinomycetota bacterium]